MASMPSAASKDRASPDLRQQVRAALVYVVGVLGVTREDMAHHLPGNHLENPMMAFKGVRSSWPIFDKN
jgi:hypothetical protein